MTSTYTIGTDATGKAERKGDTVTFTLPAGFTGAAEFFAEMARLAERIGADMAVVPEGDAMTIALTGGKGWHTYPWHGETVTIGTGY
jgi:hypothetical protein